MNTITLTESVKKQISIPDYFTIGDNAYRYDGDGKFTRIVNMSFFKITRIDNGADATDLNIDSGIVEITEKAFKHLLCIAFSKIAGFEPAEQWNDQESDVQKVA